MKRIKEVIVVEGRYDKNTLSQLVDALIIPTDGFGIFKDGEKKALLRRLAREKGLILLTDSDGAGFVIRNHLKGVIPRSQLKQAYIPDVYGKERRKAEPSREGKLGVEGMKPEILLRALSEAGAQFEDAPQRDPITKYDLYELGLSGKPDSAAKRRALMQALELPEHLSTNALLDVLNLLYTKEEFLSKYQLTPDP